MSADNTHTLFVRIVARGDPDGGDPRNADGTRQVLTYAAANKAALRAVGVRIGVQQIMYADTLNPAVKQSLAGRGITRLPAFAPRRLPGRPAAPPLFGPAAIIGHCEALRARAPRPAPRRPDEFMSADDEIEAFQRKYMSKDDDGADESIGDEGAEKDLQSQTSQMMQMRDRMYGQSKAGQITKAMRMKMPGYAPPEDRPAPRGGPHRPDNIQAAEASRSRHFADAAEPNDPEDEQYRDKIEAALDDYPPDMSSIANQINEPDDDEGGEEYDPKGDKMFKDYWNNQEDSSAI